MEVKIESFIKTNLTFLISKNILQKTKLAIKEDNLRINESVNKRCSDIDPISDRLISTFTSIHAHWYTGIEISYSIYYYCSSIDIVNDLRPAACTRYERN